MSASPGLGVPDGSTAVGSGAELGRVASVGLAAAELVSRIVATRVGAALGDEEGPPAPQPATRRTTASRAPRLIGPRDIPRLAIAVLFNLNPSLMETAQPIEMRPAALG
jgi:hypothetical protein